MSGSANRLRLLIGAAVLAAVLVAAIYSVDAQVLRVDRYEPIVPTIGRADRHQPGKFFLEKADSLISLPSTDYQILKGNVEFRKGDMFMYCDSAHFFDQRNDIQAFGNVRMEQGDTLFIYADELEYSDSLQLATLFSYGNNRVRLINRDVTLRTPTFYYDLGIELGYYQDGGELTDAQNRLTSLYGEYAPNTSEALFRTDVDLVSRGKQDTLRILSQELYYNTDTHIAIINEPAEIFSKNGVIYTDSAIYNTDTEYAELYRRSTVVTSTNRTITADSLIYDHRQGYGNAYGNMVLTDTVGKMLLTGDYGFYNELTDSALVTGRALAREYSQGDTLYLHSDTIRAFTRIGVKEIKIPRKRRAAASVPDSVAAENGDTLPIAEPAPQIMTVPDTVRYVIAAHKVKFFRSDMQGVCDSLTFLSSDSTLYMNRHPVVWSDNRQIFGKIIEIHLNDSTIDTAHLPDFGFMAEEIEPGFFQQLTGKQMTAFFTGGEITSLYVNGNVMAIVLPEESDSTINKLGNLETSELKIDFEQRNIKKLKGWPSSKLIITPLYLAKRANLYLDKFKWYPEYRPSSPEDVMVISDELAEFLNSPEEISVRERMRKSLGSPEKPAGEEQKENVPPEDAGNVEKTPVNGNEN